MTELAGRYLALLRHGEADRRRPPQPGAPALTPRGAAQARAAARQLAPLDLERVVSSDAPRARETAAQLAAGAVAVDPDLAGLRLSAGDEQPLTSLAQLRGLFADPARRPPGGESLEDLLARCAPALARATAGAGRVAVVAHRVVNAVLLAGPLGIGLEAAGVLQQDPGAVNLLQLRSSGPALVSLNVTPEDPLLVGEGGRILPDTDVAVERRLYLVRHAEATNLDGDRMGGSTRDALTARGRRQAALLGERFAALGDAAIVASPVARARETATLLARGRPLELRPALREISLGALDGASFAEIFAAAPDFMSDPGVALPGGESPAQCAERVAAELERLLARTAGRDLVVVAHGGVLRVAIACLLGLPLAAGLALRTDWAGVTVLDYAAGRWWARCLNWTPTGVAELAHTPPSPQLAERHARILGR